jgi:type I restriction enzyme S subunit
MAGDSLAEAKSLHLPSRFGDLPARWSWLRLDDACEGVFDCPHSTPKLVSTGPFVVRSQDIITGVFRTEQAARVSEETYRERTLRVVPARGDILYSREGTYFGIAAEVPEDARVCLGQRMVLIRPRNGVMDFRFLRHWLNSPIMASHIHGYRDGSVAERLNLPTIRALPVAVPPIREQRAIAHILGTLEDKIELNRRMNETLEAMARALFKSWFVDFDPVRAKAEGRDPGLPQPLAALFPDSFEDSELGEIPKGWEIGRFGEVAEQLRDQENPLSSPDELFHHFSIPAFDEGRTPKPEYGESIKSLKSHVPVGVILLSKLNPEIERVWMVDVRPGERAVCSTEFLVLRGVSPFTRSYVYCLARSPLFRQQIEGLVTGTSKSHQRAQVNSILNLAVVVPPSSIIAAFDHSADSLLARTLECRRESRTLAALRDTLLPKLISGGLRMKDAR